MSKKFQNEFDDIDDMDYEFFSMNDLDDGMNFGDSEKKSGKGYAKNVAKSVKNLSIKLHEMFLPETHGVITEFGNAISSFKDEFINYKDKAVDFIDKHKYADDGSNKLSKAYIGKTASSLFASAKEDVKNRFTTGKFVKGPFDDMDDFDFGFDDDDDEGGSYEKQEEKKEVDPLAATQLKLQKSKFDIQKKLYEFDTEKTKYIGETTLRAAEATVSANVEMFNKTQMLEEARHHMHMQYLKNIATNLYKTTAIQGAMLRSSLEYDKKSLALLAESMSHLKEMREIQVMIYKSNKENKSSDRVSLRDVFGMGFSGSEYAKGVIGNIKNAIEMSPIGMLMGFSSMFSSMGSMGMGGKNAGPLGMIMQMFNPFEMIFNSLLSSKIKYAKERIEKMVKSVPGLINQRLIQAGEEKGGFLGMLADILSIRDEESTVRVENYSNMNLDQPAAFDVRTHRTINEVIPAQLAQLVAGITGQEETRYDFRTQRFRTVSSLKREMENAEKYALRSEYDFNNAADKMDKHAMEMMSTSSEVMDQKKIMEGMNQIRKAIVMLQKGFDYDKAVSDSSYKSQLLKYVKGTEFEKEKIFNYFLAGYGSLTQDERAFFKSAAINTKSNLNDAKRNTAEYIIKNMSGGGSFYSTQQIGLDKRSLENQLMQLDRVIIKQYGSLEEASKNKLASGLMKKRIDLMNQMSSISADGSVSFVNEAKANVFEDSLEHSLEQKFMSVPNMLKNITDLLLNGIIVYPMETIPDEVWSNMKNQRKYLKLANQKVANAILTQRQEEEQMREEAREQAEKYRKNVREATLGRETGFAGTPLGRIINQLTGGALNVIQGIFGGLGGFNTSIDNRMTEEEIEQALVTKNDNYNSIRKWADENHESKGPKGWIATFARSIFPKIDNYTETEYGKYVENREKGNTVEQKLDNKIKEIEELVKKHPEVEEKVKKVKELFKTEPEKINPEIEKIIKDAAKKEMYESTIVDELKNVYDPFEQKPIIQNQNEKKEKYVPPNRRKGSQNDNRRTTYKQNSYNSNTTNINKNYDFTVNTEGIESRLDHMILLMEGNPTDTITNINKTINNNFKSKQESEVERTNPIEQKLDKIINLIENCVCNASEEVNENGEMKLKGLYAVDGMPEVISLLSSLSINVISPDILKTIGDELKEKIKKTGVVDKAKWVVGLPVRAAKWGWEKGTKAAGWAGDQIMKGVKKVNEWLPTIGETIGKTASGFGDFLGNTFRGAGKAGRGFLDGVKELFGLGRDRIIRGFDNIKNRFGELSIENIKKGMTRSAMIAIAAKYFKVQPDDPSLLEMSDDELAQACLYYYEDNKDKVTSTIGGIIGNIGQALGGFGNGLLKTLGGALESLGGGIKGGLEAGGGLLGLFREAFTTAGAGIGGFLDHIFGGRSTKGLLKTTIEIRSILERQYGPADQKAVLKELQAYHKPGMFRRILTSPLRFAKAVITSPINFAKWVGKKTGFVDRGDGSGIREGSYEDYKKDRLEEEKIEREKTKVNYLKIIAENTSILAGTVKKNKFVKSDDSLTPTKNSLGAQIGSGIVNVLTGAGLIAGAGALGYGAYKTIKTKFDNRRQEYENGEITQGEYYRENTLDVGEKVISTGPAILNMIHRGGARLIGKQVGKNAAGNGLVAKFINMLGSLLMRLVNNPKVQQYISKKVAKTLLGKIAQYAAKAAVNLTSRIAGWMATATASAGTTLIAQAVIGFGWGMVRAKSYFPKGTEIKLSHRITAAFVKALDFLAWGIPDMIFTFMGQSLVEFVYNLIKNNIPGGENGEEQGDDIPADPNVDYDDTIGDQATASAIATTTLNDEVKRQSTQNVSVNRTSSAVPDYSYAQPSEDMKAGASAVISAGLKQSTMSKGEYAKKKLEIGYNEVKKSGGKLLEIQNGVVYGDANTVNKALDTMTIKVKSSVLGKYADLQGLHPTFKPRIAGLAQDYYLMTGKHLKINQAYRTEQDQLKMKQAMPGKAASPYWAAPHLAGIAIDVDTDIANVLEESGLLRKWGLWRPLNLPNSNPRETWHIEPIGARQLVNRGTQVGPLDNYLVNTLGFTKGVFYNPITTDFNESSMKLVNSTPGENQQYTERSGIENTAEAKLADKELANNITTQSPSTTSPSTPNQTSSVANNATVSQTSTATVSSANAGLNGVGATANDINKLIQAMEKIEVNTRKTYETLAKHLPNLDVMVKILAGILAATANKVDNRIQTESIDFSSLIAKGNL